MSVPSTGPKRGRVVVIGGGLAGLVAAWQLQADDWEVVVLEAAERLGGRVVTVRDRFDAGQYAEAGATFIYEGQNAVLDLAADLSLQTVETGGAAGDTVLTPTGPLPLDAYLSTDGGAVGADVLRWERSIAELSSTIDPDDPTKALDAPTFDAQPVSGLLDAAALHPGARFLIEREISRRYGASPPALSALFLLQQTSRAGSGLGTTMRRRRVVGGTDLIVARLAADLAGTVTTGATVTAVDQQGPHVRVTHSRGGTDADAVVCAVPLTALGAIRFAPSLPQDMAAAAGLAYGAAVMTLLQYRTRPWEPLGLSGDAVSWTAVGSVWNASQGQPGPNGLLNAMSSADDAEALGPQNEDVRVGTATATVDGFLPGSSWQLDAVESIVWRTQEHIRGTNVVFGPNQVVPFWNVLRRPHGRVHFAGEHTDSWVATMEGAVRSGQRAARELREPGRVN